MKKKLLIVGFVFALLAAIPLTVYLLQQQQETRSRATAATNLTITSPANPVPPNQDVSVNVIVKPGSNHVSFMKLNISYDATKLATSGAGFEPTASLSLVLLEGPLYTSGNISVTLSTGADPTKIIQTDTIIGKITFKGLSPGPSQVTITGSQILSANQAADQPSENVLLDTTPGTITISGSIPTPTSIPGPTSPAGINQLPVCSSLSIDRALTGSAPYAITFTGTGTDADGTITKATFNFGDGPIQNVTQAGGIGTNTVSVSVAHTYNNPGTFTAKVTFTDNSNGTSVATTACTSTIIIVQGTPQPTQSGGGAQPTAIPTQTVATPTTPLIPTATRTPMVSTGPGEIIILTGIGGLIISAIGAALIFIF